MEKGKRKKEEGVEFDFGGLFKGLGDFFESVAEIAEEGKTEIEKTGEITFDKAKKLRGMYGINVKVSSAGIPVVETFGTRKRKFEKREPPEPEVREPLVDAFEEKENIRVIAELPGIEEKDIKIEIEGDILKLSADGKERKYSKEITLPCEVTGDMQKTYNNGVLELILRKK